MLLQAKIFIRIYSNNEKKTSKETAFHHAIIRHTAIKQVGDNASTTIHLLFVYSNDNW